MADRTSAGIFGDLFNILAEEPNKKNKEIAKRIFNETYLYDFNLYQMDADESLIKLGLAQKISGTEYGEQIIYNSYDK